MLTAVINSKPFAALSFALHNVERQAKESMLRCVGYLVVDVCRGCCEGFPRVKTVIYSSYLLYCTGSSARYIAIEILPIRCQSGSLRETNERSNRLLVSLVSPGLVRKLPLLKS